VVDNESRKTGVKDKYLTAFLVLLKEQYEAEKTQGLRAATADFLQKLRRQLPDRLFNPALFIPGMILPELPVFEPNLDSIRSGC
jgi:hypothetical protein